MSDAGGLRRKIWIAFILQVAAISFATVLGVYGASAVLKHTLIQQALTDEAAHYWTRVANQPDAAVPDTYNMQGFLIAPGESTEHLPPELAALGPGYHNLPRTLGGSLVFVDDGSTGRLFLVFKQTQVDALAFYFGMVPLVVVLAVIYVIAWFTYRVSRRAVSPVIWLANEVQRLDPKRPEFSALRPENLPVDVEGETLVLAKSLHEFGLRLESFVERERDFTRDASHELRTPITVIRMATDLLLADGGLDPYADRSVRRIQRAIRDMEVLIEAFLILAREGDVGLPDEDFEVLEIIHDEVEKVKPLLAGKPVAIEVDAQSNFVLHAPSRVVSVLLGNLLRNACNYTEQGAVVVRVLGDEIVIEDSGVGMDEKELKRAFEPFYRAGAVASAGHGIGLSIVARLSDRFGWPVRLESEKGVGTRVHVSFPQAQPLPS